MGGGDGTVIVHDSVIATLGNPLVSGQLPPSTQPAVVATLITQDPTTWTAQNKKVLAHAFSWAICNL